MKDQERDAVLELGTWMGRKQAFASLAGGCSAADAECLRQIRRDRRYRALGLSWAEFCKQQIGLTRQHADRLIRRLEEFGPQFFRLAQATGITADEYRRIAGSVGEKGLTYLGELIPIGAEDAPRLIAAVEELRRQAEPEAAKNEAEDHDRAIEKAERLLRAAGKVVHQAGGSGAAAQNAARGHITRRAINLKPAVGRPPKTQLSCMQALGSKPVLTRLVNW